MPGRLPANMIQSGPNSENDKLIRAPKLAAIKGEQGIGRQRGLRIDTRNESAARGDYAVAMTVLASPITSHC